MEDKFLKHFHNLRKKVETEIGADGNFVELTDFKVSYESGELCFWVGVRRRNGSINPNVESRYIHRNVSDKIHNQTYQESNLSFLINKINEDTPNPTQLKTQIK